MEETFRLGRIAGIPVGVNWSLLVIFALIAVGLSSGRFPVIYPDHEPWVYGLSGLLTATVFFASILAHELGHAVVARRKGVEVKGITLWLFGGMARFGGEPDNPADELRIAGVGPLISLLLGGVFAVVAWLVAAAGLPDIVVGVAGWLAIINGALAVFNLMPAAPLDGGRILRAWLWNRNGDRRKAGLSAAKAGRVFGLALVGLGIAEIAFLMGLGGVWFILIGFFIMTAARGEEMHARLKGVRVREVMTADPQVVPDWLTVRDFLEQHVLTSRWSCFPLRGFGGELTGVATLSAVKRVPAAERADVRIRDVACPMERVPVFAPDEDLSDALPKLAGSCTDGRALVIDAGELVGIVSPRDVARVAELADLREPDRHAQVS